MCKKCIVFVRVSTKQQDLDAQRERVLAVAMADGYKRDEISIVEGKESAIKLDEEERETLAEMKQIISDNPSIESVYVFAIDRLARKVSVILSVKDYLLGLGINLVFLNPHKMGTIRVDEKTGEKKEDELTALLLMLLSYGAQMEMKVKQARMKTAKDALKANNKIASGKPMFGYYKAADKSVKVNPKEAEIVRRVYVDYVTHHKSMLGIHNELVAEGVFKQAKDSTAQLRIKEILCNPAYTGDYSYKDKGKALLYPAIITKELQAKAIATIEKNRIISKTTHKNVYYGKGIIKLTNNNNRVMVAHAGNICYKEPDSHILVNINALDRLIWASTGTIYMLQREKAHHSNKEEYTKAIEENNAKVANLQMLLDEIRSKQQKAFRLYMDGRVSESIYNEEMAKIDKDADNWSKQIAALESQNKTYEMMIEENESTAVFNPRRLEEITDDVERKKIIDSCIKEVLVTRNDDATFDIEVIAKDEVQPLYKMFNAKWKYWARGGYIHLLVTDVDGKYMDVTNTIEHRFRKAPKKRASLI